MNRSRLASIIVFLWGVLQVWSLLLIGFYPKAHPVGWVLCLVAFGISVGLWMGKPWARITFLILGGGLAVSYAVVYFLGLTPCARDMAGCNVLLIISQPVLTLAALAILLKPFASNHTIERDARRNGARPSL